jgi:S-(hydroxymethyl)glutathione dehydrogenase/alcohol dehydrogenase
MQQAALVSCGVVTGWGSATYAGGVAVGDTVVVIGTGGVGMNAVQGAAMAGARNIVAVDPEQFKRDSAPIFGATHVASNLEDAASIVSMVTYNHGADVAIITMGLNDPSILDTVMSLVRKAGRVVLTSVTAMGDTKATIDLQSFSMNRKQLIGCLFGNANPRFDIPRLLKLYEAGKLKLDELITNTYSLDEINQGYQDMRDGKNLRGVLVL